MPDNSNTIGLMLKQQLSQFDLEPQAISSPNPDGSLDIPALKLVPVSTYNEKPLFLPVPVSLNLQLDTGNTITKLQEHLITTDMQNSAGKMYRDMVDRGEIEGIAQDPPGNRSSAGFGFHIFKRCSN